METATLVVNSIATFFAVVAVIIAIVVYKKTARLQRNAIGYSMLDDRIKIWKYLSHDQNQPEAVIKRLLEGRDWELEKFKLLFSESLVKEYEALREYGEQSGDLATKVDFLEREGLPIRRDGETINNDDYTRYTTVKHQRKTIFEAGLDASTGDLVAFKKLCQRSFPCDKWQEYYDSVFTLLQRHSEQKKMLSTFMDHLHQEVKTSVSEG